MQQATTIFMETDRASTQKIYLDSSKASNKGDRIWEASKTSLGTSLEEDSSKELTVDSRAMTVPPSQ